MLFFFLADATVYASRAQKQASKQAIKKEGEIC
jgi:hypothetical protein